MDIRELLLSMPFEEAVAFIRKKVNIPTQTWQDLWKEMHELGFVVAGAMQESLLEDLRSAVDAAIVKGESLQDFRSRFDDIVTRYGWVYYGDRNWRTKIICNTNLRTAYLAGRYQQMTHPDVTALRPYWQYRHGNSRNPRIKHIDPHPAGWNGLILRHDDPWWNTHYPPNGFGCRCRVITLSQRDMDKRGWTVADKAPDNGTYRWKDKDGNIHNIPVGIDPGWDYNVGQTSGRDRARI